MSESLHMVASGAVTPIGLDARSTAAAARAGISRLGGHPFMVDATGEPVRCGRVPTVPPSLVGARRLVALLSAALTEAVESSALVEALADGATLFLGLPAPRPGFGEADGEAVAREISAAPPPGIRRLQVAHVVGGHAAAIEALKAAGKSISKGETGLCIVGGVDSYLDADTLDWLEENRLYAREGVRGGFSPGEAAGVCVVADRSSCRRWSLDSLARIRGVATGIEPRSLDSDEGLLGEGLTDVVVRATRGLRLPDERIATTYCDINGERHRADEWGFTAMRASHTLGDATAYTTPVGACGDIGAASPIVNAALHMEGMRRKYRPSTPALIWGSSPHGLRGAFVLDGAEN